MQSSVILIKVLILFVLIIAGFIARFFNVFNDETTKGINSILIRITLPALIFSSLQKEFSPELFKQSMFLLFISFTVYFACFLFALIMPFFLRPRHSEKGVFQFIIMFSNVGFMGFPVLAAIFGEESLFFASIYNLPFNLLTFTLGVFLLIRTKEGGYKPQLEHFVNPAIIAIIAGFVFFLCSWKLPSFIGEPIAMLGDMTIPLSMFVIGAMLRKGKIQRIFTNWRIYVIAALRLVFIPLVIYFILKHFVLDTMLLGVIVIIAAMPAAASTPILAEEYGGSSEIAAQAVFITTLFSVITIPAFAMLFI